MSDQDREPDHDQPEGLVLVPELVEGSHPLAPFAPPKLASDPLAIYMAQLRSPASRRSIFSVLTRAARIFDALDREIDPTESEATAATYPWGTPGAISFAKVQAAVALIAEEPSPGHEEADEPKKKIAMARLLASALKGLARAAFSLRLLDVEERLRIDDLRVPKSTGSERGRRLSDAEVARLDGAADDLLGVEEVRLVGLLGPREGAEVARLHAGVGEVDVAVDDVRDGVAHLPAAQGVGREAERVEIRPGCAAEDHGVVDVEVAIFQAAFEDRANGRGSGVDHGRTSLRASGAVGGANVEAGASFSGLVTDSSRARIAIERSRSAGSTQSFPSSQRS